MLRLMISLLYLDEWTMRKDDIIFKRSIKDRCKFMKLRKNILNIEMQVYGNSI